MDGNCRSLAAGTPARRRFLRARWPRSLAALLLGALACLQAWAGDARKPRVLTSFLPGYCFAANVAGEFAEVEHLLPAAVDPHEFQFSPRDLRRLAATDLIVVNGLGLEGWLTKALELAADQRPPRIVEAAAGLPEELLLGPIAKPLEGGSSPGPRAGHANPHIWLDPLLAAHSVTNIQRALAQLDPAHADDYARNANDFAARLHRLDDEIHAAVATFRPRKLVTQHDAFAYFARRYGLHIVGVLQELPEVEPSPQHLKRLANLIREHGLKVIFTEPRSASRLAAQLTHDLGLEVAELDTLESGPLTPTAYEDGLRQNLRVLEKYLK
jgi:ABC-type Zn uptake system ZnuABC Zn-binding protein ZnuA